MKRRGNISPLIETEENFELAWAGYSEDKHSRAPVRKFETRLSQNLSILLDAYRNETWQTSPYKSEIKHERKTRIISKLPIKDHVMQWAACLHVEPLLCDTFIRRSCSCVKNRGTHDFVNLLRKDMNDDAEYYSFSGSEVMINQACCEINKEDLPCPTVIKEFRNKRNLKFYKFT